MPGNRRASVNASDRMSHVFEKYGERLGVMVLACNTYTCEAEAGVF